MISMYEKKINRTPELKYFNYENQYIHNILTIITHYFNYKPFFFKLSSLLTFGQLCDSNFFDWTVEVLIFGGFI